MNRYELLTEALIKARKKAAELNGTPDTGSCNFDSLELHLPNYRKDKVIEAIEAAGLSGFDTIRWGSTLYVITPPDAGQAYNRTAKAEVMSKSMQADGYNASVWYQMD